MAGMTKKDREELAARLDGLDHYRKMAIEHCLNYGMTSKRAELEKLRAEEAAAQAEAEAAQAEQDKLRAELLKAITWANVAADYSEAAAEVVAEVAEAIAAADLSAADPAEAAAPQETDSEAHAAEIAREELAAIPAEYRAAATAPLIRAILRAAGTYTPENFARLFSAACRNPSQ